jgi:hypothetical protein
VCRRDSGRKTELNKGGHELISIEDYGYGKGYVAAQEEFRRLLEALDRLQRDRAMHVVILMHSAIRKFENPNGLNYDRWEPKMHLKSARLITEWVENLFFGYYETEAGKLGDEKKAKGVSTGRRMLGTRYNAMYDAKNRMNLPEAIELKQPSDMIPYLLGEHLVGADTPTHAAPARTASAPPAQQKKAEAQKPAEQKAAETPPREPPQPAKRSQQVDEEQTLVAEMTNALTLAKKMGTKYAAKIDKWAKAANGDPSKLKQLVDLVITDFRDHEAQNQQPAQNQ